MSIVLTSNQAEIKYLSEILVIDPRTYIEAIEKKEDVPLKFKVIASVLFEPVKDTARGLFPKTTDILLLQRGLVNKDWIHWIAPEGNSKESTRYKKLAKRFKADSFVEDKCTSLNPNKKADNLVELTYKDEKRYAQIPVKARVIDSTPKLYSENERPFTLLSLSCKLPRENSADLNLLRLEYDVEFHKEGYLIQNCPNAAEFSVMSPLKVLDELEKEIDNKISRGTEKSKVTSRKSFHNKLASFKSSYACNKYPSDMFITSSDETVNLRVYHDSYTECFMQSASPKTYYVRLKERYQPAKKPFRLELLVTAPSCDLYDKIDRLDEKLSNELLKVKKMLQRR
ncbi:hypothetical protein GF336_00715 [Candidatus Woesearchaeota archaeon]|nr:hypothetical protein [Candidatus Woesearchaeota archaeon]